MFRLAIAGAVLAGLAGCAQPPFALFEDLPRAAKPLATGPALICLKYSSFQLGPGEQITAFRGGAEAMAIQIESPAGDYQIGESEIFADPGKLRYVGDHRDGRGATQVYKTSGGRLVYGISGPTTFSDGEARIVLLLQGPALTGGAGDARIFERLTVADPTNLNCEATLSYSWNSLLGLH